MREEQYLIRFQQLFRIAYPDGKELKADCSDGLKIELINICEQIDPTRFFGSAYHRPIIFSSKSQELYLE